MRLEMSGELEAEVGIEQVMMLGTASAIHSQLSLSQAHRMTDCKTACKMAYLRMICQARHRSLCTRKQHGNDS
jgi:hypothetical protein